MNQRWDTCMIPSRTRLPGTRIESAGSPPWQRLPARNWSGPSGNSGSRDGRPDLMKKLREYLKENVFVTARGNYLQAAFMCTYEAMGANSILLATDYPYDDSEECMAFLKGLPLSKEDKARTCFGNASRIGLSV